MARSTTRVTCTCDGCGKTATCSTTERAPPGWFYVLTWAGGDQLNEGGPIACSVSCQGAIQWAQQELPQPKRGK